VVDGEIRRGLVPVKLSTDLATEEQQRSSSHLSALRPETNAGTIGTSANASTDQNQDVEPSVVSVLDEGVKFTSTTFTKYVDLPGFEGRRPRVHFSTTSDLTSFPQRGQLPLPLDYTASGDPLMAVNPYAGGIAPGRMYCTGIMFNETTTLANNNPANLLNAIGLWRSDDGGRTWSLPTAVRVSGGGGILHDKPAMRFHGMAAAWAMSTSLGCSSI